MTDPARAFLNHGNVDQWTRGAGPITGIGTTMGHGSWPIYTAPEKPTSWRVFWRNPDTNGGDLWSQPGKMFESPGILELGALTPASNPWTFVGTVTWHSDVDAEAP